MKTTQRLNKDELLATFQDEEWRQKFLTISNLIIFLEKCILANDYKIPDDLNNAIALTPVGTRLHQALVTKHRVPAKEARLLCFLAVGHVEIFIDVEKTDVSALVESIHRQVQERQLLFAFIFGRELYDRAASLFEDERPSLNYEDTTRLLSDLPTGVFQMGDLVVGPYGLLRSSVSRWIGPKTMVPLYHCSELTCEGVHSCQLTSDTTAAINENQSKMHKLLDAEPEDPSAWSEFLLAIADIERIGYDDNSAATLPYLIGDALSLTELRELTARLMDGTGGQLRRLIAPLGLTGKSNIAVEKLGKAELLQITLLVGDDAVAAMLDTLVAENVVRIPVGEIRTPVTNGARRSGRFRLQAQLGSYGLRFHAREAPLGPLRLRRLVDGLYALNDPADVAELEWQLRDVEAPTLAARLEEYVRASTPEEVLRRLVLARRTNTLTACAELSIDEKCSANDETLIKTLLWKLGFEVSGDEDVTKRFWQLHERMKQVTQTAGVSALVDQEAVRALASNYFVLLEEILDDCLAFDVWALTTDHLSTARPFSYRLEIDRPAAFARLNMAEGERDSGPEEIVFGEKNVLYELCRGFACLAEHLQEVMENAVGHLRSSLEYPKFVEWTNLKRFPFHHTFAFLDLQEDAQNRIIAVLKEVSRVLVAADVNGVRNDQLHFRRSTADLGRLAECLSAVGDAVAALEKEGLARLLFRPVKDQGDQWGRHMYILADPRGREIAFARPSSHDWLRLPGLRSRQYLMTSAVFAEPNEILRFLPSVDSEYSTMWDSYPMRRRPGRRADGLQPAAEISSAAAGPAPGPS